MNASEYSLVALPYEKDLIARYQTLNDLPGFTLLESMDKTRGRYDIVTACPYDKVVLNRDDDLADSLIRLRQRMSTCHLPLDLPFQGGAIGFFSYDLAQILAGIPCHAPAAVAGSLSLAELGFYDWAIIADHVLQQVTLLAVNTHHDTRAITQEVLERWHTGDSDFYGGKAVSSFLPLVSKEEYRDVFYAVQHALQKGRCYQVNYTQPFNARYDGGSWSVYRRVRASNPVPFAAYMKTEWGNILSFSPERFIKMENRVLQTSPIKGTERRSSDPDDDKRLMAGLLSSAKNRAENVMIVDMMRNDFSKIAQVGSVKVNTLCELQSFAEVHHLVSHVEALCHDAVSPLDAFLSCFPGASITGAPKLEAMKMIAEQERFARSVYCGSIGYFSSHGCFDTNIAIRTMLARDNVLSLSAGGGLVVESDCEEEYQECLTKIAAISKGIH
ncbi:aminodeoxychorismate synthase component I [Legionella spiritensis]|uniref:aminodeoxychorismate synthase n=1 Tax=Legionella spiritensis TaxID=452 RepID=A0A0W0YY70_LEGSP|nr:aminodeoxychorismate synthase component I [Legionella spiritensis]KTD61599.1 para-aminobenzoate synthase, component I [Legionella spiritensis]SNV39488.1 para-aminobenzoate synthase, component I [Legionella spiritensis]